MPAAVVEATFDIADQEVSIVRNALKEIGDDASRETLWQLLDLLNRIDPTNPGRIRQTVSLAPYGPVRECVARIAQLRTGTRAPVEMPTRSAATAGYRRPPLIGVTGRAADHDTWTSSWVWRSFAPDALEAVADRRYRQSHSPVPVLYRHAGDPVGLTQAWLLSDGGDLNVEIMVLPHNRAQTAARYVQDGLIRGLSLGVRTTVGAWDHLGWREWEPRDQRLDMVRSHRIAVEEISLTPDPAQPNARIRSVW